MCNLGGEKGEFPTPSKLCPSKLLKIYLVICIQVYLGGWKDKPDKACFAEHKEIKKSDPTTESLTVDDFKSGAKELEFSTTNDISVSFFTFRYTKVPHL